MWRFELVEWGPHTGAVLTVAACLLSDADDAVLKDLDGLLHGILAWGGCNLPRLFT
jgi:hypothetical protein